MHRQHVVDPGSEVTEGSGAWGVGTVFRWGLGCPLLWKSYNIPTRLQHNCTAPYPWFSGFGSTYVQSVRPNLYGPQAYSTAVSHPMSTSRLWIVGIMSVGTESVGTAWCTRFNYYEYVYSQKNTLTVTNSNHTTITKRHQNVTKVVINHVHTCGTVLFSQLF